VDHAQCLVRQKWRERFQIIQQLFSNLLCDGTAEGVIFALGLAFNAMAANDFQGLLTKAATWMNCSPFWTSHRRSMICTKPRRTAATAGCRARLSSAGMPRIRSLRGTGIITLNSAGLGVRDSHRGCRSSPPTRKRFAVAFPRAQRLQRAVHRKQVCRAWAPSDRPDRGHGQ
jgi:hypothetical protein